MSDENNKNDKTEDQNTENEEDTSKKTQEDEDTSGKKTSTNSDEDMIAKLVAEKTKEQLKEIKEKLDKSFKERDEAKKRIAEFERKEREAELKALEAEGKTKEAYEGRLADKEAELAALRKQNTELSRDVSVRDALKSYIFRNDKASDMAFREIVGNLVQNEQGKWVHRSGISIKDYCEAFSKDEEQSFLFKAKTNSGGGSSANNDKTPDTSNNKKGTSLFSLPQAEVIKMAAEGKLPNQRKR